MAKWPNHFISGKQFQKRPNMADLAFKKTKWQPCVCIISKDGTLTNLIWYRVQSATEDTR